MLTWPQFRDGVIDGNYPKVPAPAGGAMPGEFDGFDEPTEEVKRSFAHGLLEASGFGTGQEVDRNDIVKPTDALHKHLPPRLYFWPQEGRAHWTILVEFEQTGRELLQQPLFRSERGQQGLEEVAYRAIQGVLAAFESGGEQKRGGAVKKGPQTETLVVVSIPDDRRAKPGSTEPLPRLVYFGTRSTETNSLEVFVLKEEARQWDAALRDEHFKQVHARHFSKLGEAKWQDAFVTGPERKLAEDLRSAAQKNPTDEDALKRKMRELLDQLAHSYGLKRRKENNNECVSLKDLEPGHALGVPIAKARTKNFVNPLKGVAIYDAEERLRGFMLYIVDATADRAAIQASMKANNRLHNVLVLYPGEKDPEIEVWQGQTVLRGKLLQGGRLSNFDGDGGIVQLLSRFLAVSESAIESDKKLAEELAARANTLKDLALDELNREIAADGGPLKTLHETFSAALATLTPEKFADAYAQAITYGMLSARWLSSERTDLLFTRKNLPKLLPATSPFLRKLYSELVVAKFDSSLQWLLDELVSLLARTDVDRVFKGATDPAIHFYEDFLNAYDPGLRQRMGVYYTPKEVVNYIVRAAHQCVIDGFGLPLGLADATKWGAYAKAKGIPKPEGIKDDDYVVQILDPAVGTGTFPLRVLEVIFETMTREWAALPEEEQAGNWKKYVHEHLLPRVNAFELMMAPYIVCHLRLGLALEKGLARDSGRSVDIWGYHFAEDDRLRVFLTNTLEMRGARGDQGKTFAAAVAEEANRAQTLKDSGGVSVVVGNPPYDAVSGADPGTGAWVQNGQVRGRESTQSLFKDLQDVLRANNVNFSQDAHLYNLFAYFLRWCGWRLFESRGSAPAVVGMITPTAWLDADSFMGLRKFARRDADQIWCVDLGGEGRGAVASGDNIFGILTAVGVSITARSRSKAQSPSAPVHYIRLDGGAKEKLDQIDALAAEPFTASWGLAAPGDVASFVPPAGGAEWLDLPSLADVFPWQQPGCKFGRTWPIAPHRDALVARWKRLVSSTATERPILFVTAEAGRKITTKVGDLPTLVSLKEGAPHRPIVRYGYRSFDRQWAFDDPRMAKTESPSLWRARSERQVFLTSLMTKEPSAGPMLVASAHVPDLDYFCGRGGKDVIPLYRDGDAEFPNVAKGLLRALGKALGLESSPSPEDLAAYTYALLSSPRYQNRFAAGLANKEGPRVPLTRSADLWRKAVATGERLLWLHTFAERFQSAAAKRGASVPEVDGLAWSPDVTKMPEGTGELDYDADSRTLIVGNGRVSGVRPEVWDFKVSGMPVVYKWLGYRTKRGTGRAASEDKELDKIRLTTWPQEWSDELLDLLRVLTLTVEMQPAQAALVDAICEGPLVPASALPQPEEWQRKVPIDDDADAQQNFLKGKK
jgi:hypothetical protein